MRSFPRPGLETRPDYQVVGEAIDGREAGKPAATQPAPAAPATPSPTAAPSK